MVVLRKLPDVVEEWSFRIYNILTAELLVRLSEGLVDAELVERRVEMFSLRPVVCWRFASSDNIRIPQKEVGGKYL